MFSHKFVALFGLLSIFVSVECKRRNLGEDLGDFAEAIGNLINAADDCKYKCENGQQPRAIPNYNPKPNGCGSYGFHFDVKAVPGATECCNLHDNCYDTCNSDKAKCDRQLEQCLNHSCREMKDPHSGKTEEQVEKCSTVVKYIFAGVSAIGCDAYKAAQENACSCKTSSGEKRSHGRYNNIRY